LDLEKAIPTTETEKIAKFLSRNRSVSRKMAEEWVTQGRILVDGERMKNPAIRITTKNEIRLDGAIVTQKEPTVKLFTHYKKSGIIVSEKKVDNKDALIPILKHFGLPRLIPVEPLDMHTEGLVLLTNSGEFAKYLRYNRSIVRKYRIRARGKVCIY